MTSASVVNFSGAWHLNLEKSQLKGPTPQRIDVRIHHEGIAVTQSVTVVSASGEEQQTEFVFRTDGTATPFTHGGNAGEVTARWQGSTLVVETRLTVGNREMLFRDHWTLSADESVLTMTHPDDVLAGQVSVLERE